MTAKQILDAFSETLMQDERILSPRERELLTSILQNSRSISSANAQTQSAVTAAIAQSVGETVAQRAFALLGGSIVEQILAGPGVSADGEISRPTVTQFGVPQPPSGPTIVPQPPSGPRPNIVPQPPSGPHPVTVPQPPSGPRPLTVPQPPSGPQGIRRQDVPVRQGSDASLVNSGGGVGVMEAAPNIRSQCVVLDEFLAPHEMDELFAYALQHEAEFQSSEVIAPSGEAGVIDYLHRRSRVLMDLGKHQDVIMERIRGVLPRVLDELGVEEFPIRKVEAQITASNDGDFFGTHSDDAQAAIASRRITFVYFFHREPVPFAGGELRLHDPRGGEQRNGSAREQSHSYQTIVPQQNQIVFFPCEVMHEITPVECQSKAFADSRFTLNGWLHK